MSLYHEYDLIVLKGFDLVDGYLNLFDGCRCLLGTLRGFNLASVRSMNVLNSETSLDLTNAMGTFSATSLCDSASVIS